MPFPRPTLAELRSQIRQDIQSGSLPGVLAVARYSVLNVFATVWAGIAHLHYGYLDWIARQAVPWTSTDENLEAWGNLKGIVRKAPSTSSGSVNFSASDGAAISPGTEIQISGGPLVKVTSGATASGGTITVTAQAETAGATGNSAAGTAVTLATPVAGVQTTGTVLVPFTGGADAESDDDLRTRILAAFAQGGENGNEKDYIKWALEVPGITRAWCNGCGFGPGTVVVYVMLDDANASQGGYPQGSDGSAETETRYKTATGDQLRVADFIQPLRPVTALVIVCSPIRQPVDFILADLGSSNTPATQLLIQQALGDVFRRVSSPGGTVYPSAWIEALAALDLPRYAILAPVGPVIADGIGSLPDLGTISFRT